VLSLCLQDLKRELFAANIRPGLELAAGNKGRALARKFATCP